MRKRFIIIWINKDKERSDEIQHTPIDIVIPDVIPAAEAWNRIVNKVVESSGTAMDKMVVVSVVALN